MHGRSRPRAASLPTAPLASIQVYLSRKQKYCRPKRVTQALSGSTFNDGFQLTAYGECA
jgi:hypothetical protein